MFHMLIAHELDDSDQDSVSSRVEVKLKTRVIKIHHPSLGLDFIMGTEGSRVYFIPLGSILEISGLEHAAQRQVSFEQILAAQQQPVMIHYHLPERISWAWLLTISSPWLRLAHPQGVIWVPLGRVSYAEVGQSDSGKIWGAD